MMVRVAILQILGLNIFVQRTNSTMVIMRAHHRGMMTPRFVTFVTVKARRIRDLAARNFGYVRQSLAVSGPV